ncbi:MAG: hypothetical protein WC095_02455 [Candidatus Paceibacterota bacterium]
MNNISLEPSFLHHAYLLVGDRSSSKSFLVDFLGNQLNISISGNSDVRVISVDSLSVDFVRSIKVSEEFKAFGDKKKIFIIETDFITEEAQNALLKIFEEPTKGTHFFVNISQDIILPTLRSRMHIINIKDLNEKNTKALPVSVLDRMKKVKSIVDDISDENQTKQSAVDFLNNIEMELYKSGVEKNHKALVLCEQARKSLYDRGAPIKIILESLILSL